MTLVVVGGDRAGMPHRSEAMPGAVRDKLMEVLPAAASVLHVGAADRLLESSYCARQPRARWLTAHADSVTSLPGPFDLVLLGPGLLQRPEDATALLRALRRVASTDCRLFACVRNALQPELFERLAESDVSGGEPGPAHSVSSAFRLLMDAGWMPALAADCPVEFVRPEVLAAAVQLAQTLGVPRLSALRSLQRDQLIVEARALFAEAPSRGEEAQFTVVVPTTRETQLRLNVEQSPGLREVAARIVSYRHARNPAEALERSLPHCDRDWVLFCHQDVYFPAGFGRQLDALLADVPAAERRRTLIGFAGMGANRSTRSSEPAGFVVDRISRFDHAASEAAVSIDELAIVVARDSLHRIDPAIGWHLWATELCLAAIHQHQLFARIVRLPVFHNSNNDYVLPQAFNASGAYLAQKYAGFGRIHTLCGVIDAPAASAAA